MLEFLSNYYTPKPAGRQVGKLPVAKRSNEPFCENITRFRYKDITSQGDILSKLIYPVAFSQ